MSRLAIGLIYEQVRLRTDLRHRLQQLDNDRLRRADATRILRCGKTDEPRVRRQGILATSQIESVALIEPARHLDHPCTTCGEGIAAWREARDVEDRVTTVTAELKGE